MLRRHVHLWAQPSVLSSVAMNSLLNLAWGGSFLSPFFPVVDRPPMWVLLGWAMDMKWLLRGKENRQTWMWMCDYDISHTCTQDNSEVLNKAGLGKDRDSQGLPFMFLAWCSLNCVSKKIKESLTKAFQVIIKRLQVTKLVDSRVRVINISFTLPLSRRGAKSLLTPFLFNYSPFSED